MRITIIGGASYQWTPKLVTDIFGTPSLAGCDLVLEDIDGDALDVTTDFARHAASAMGVGATVSSTTDQRRALDGADFVVVTISTGGFDSMAVDLDVPARHGIRQSVGDTVGPGGITRALRNIPVLAGIARDMAEVCPDAWLLNITNPMTCLTRAACKVSPVKTVGLCHEVGNTVMDLAIAFGVPHTDIRATVTGVNHFPIVTALEVGGRDGFDALAELLDGLGGLDAFVPARDEPEAEPFSALDFARRNRLKLALFAQWGALPAAGDRHLAEFLPGILTAESGWGAAWGIELTPIARRMAHQQEYIAGVRAVLSGDAELETWPSGELVAPVMDSLVTGTRRELPLNLPNTGQCPDLPAEAVVESICVVDGEGIRGRDAVVAPTVPAEFLHRHVTVQELTVEAGLHGDRALADAAYALDPLAGRIDALERQAMVEELLAGTAAWLAEFAPVAI